MRCLGFLSAGANALVTPRFESRPQDYVALRRVQRKRARSFCTGRQLPSSTAVCMVHTDGPSARCFAAAIVCIRARADETIAFCAGHQAKDRRRHHPSRKCGRLRGAGIDAGHHGAFWLRYGPAFLVQLAHTVSHRSEHFGSSDPTREGKKSVQTCTHDFHEDC